MNWLPREGSGDPTPRLDDKKKCKGFSIPSFDPRGVSVPWMDFDNGRWVGDECKRVLEQELEDWTMDELASVG